MEAGVLSALSFAWFYLSSGSPVSKHSKNGECSCSHGLQAFISHTRLSKELFVFLPLLSSGYKATGDRGKVFVCVTRVPYHTPGFSVSKKNLGIFLFRHLPFVNCVGCSTVNDHCRGVLVYSNARCSTPSENEASS